LKVDCLIIGAGPIGLACAIAAKKAGISSLIVDRGTLVNSIYHYPSNMTFFSTSDRLEIGEVPFISNSPKPTRSEALEYYRRVTLAWELKVNLYEEIISVVKEDQLFDIETTKTTHQATSIIVATGFYDLPFLLNIPGESLSKVKHYYREAHPYFGMNVAVIGSANSAVDAALDTCRKGAKKVTMIIREAEIGSNVKYWARPDIINRIEEGTITAYFESTITEIREDEIDIKTSVNKVTLVNDFVLAMTGYQPDFKFLNAMGVMIGRDVNRTPVHNSETMETNVPGIFLAGVICGGLKTNKWFIENSREHAELIIKKLIS
jgi:thioredoxin reductase (NADPH)|tara:strand:+ start:484 stop:1443 length:960 start_codon:yes stop_codon:yes gene_type:complete